LGNAVLEAESTRWQSIEQNGVAKVVLQEAADILPIAVHDGFQAKCLAAAISEAREDCKVPEEVMAMKRLCPAAASKRKRDCEEDTSRLSLPPSKRKRDCGEDTSRLSPLPASKRKGDCEEEIALEFALLQSAAEDLPDGWRVHLTSRCLPHKDIYYSNVKTGMIQTSRPLETSEYGACKRARLESRMADE